MMPVWTRYSSSNPASSSRTNILQISAVLFNLSQFRVQRADLKIPGFSLHPVKAHRGLEADFQHFLTKMRFLLYHFLLWQHNVLLLVFQPAVALTNVSSERKEQKYHLSQYMVIILWKTEGADDFSEHLRVSVAIEVFPGGDDMCKHM